MDEPKPVNLKRKLWINTGCITLGIFLFYLGYVAILDNTLAPSSFAKMVAGVSNLLLGMSLALSSVGYFFNFLDSKVIYRKYFGLMGYFTAMLYCFLLVIVRPEWYFYGFFENFWTSDFLLGLSAMAIFTGMALISNDAAMRRIGPKRWRSYLRWGFVAYFLLVVRAILNNENPIGSEPVPEMWAAYLANPDNLPPARLLFSIIAMFVICLRLAVTFDKWRKKRSASAVPTPTQTPAPPIAPVA